MILLTRETRILLGVVPADFRKGIDGFQGLCRGALGQDPANGTLYVFRNRAATMIRVLTYHEGGFWLMTKRLSKGRFRGWPTSVDEPMSAGSAEALRALLAGDAWREVAGRTLPAGGPRRSDRAQPPASSPASTCATV